MTINTQLYNWQQSSENWDAAPYEKPSPNLLALLKYLQDRWGGVSLGIHGDRPIRGGSTPSSHAYGAALDWRWQFHENFPTARFITRDVLDNHVIPVLITWSMELGIQAIHDAGRIWRSDRPGTELDGEWVNQYTGYGGWIHIETTKQAWADDVDVAWRIAEAFKPPVIKPVPGVINFRDGWWGWWPNNPKPTIRLGAKGDIVRYLQSVIFHKAGGNIAIDGDFGPQTERRVRDLQRFFGLTIDGVVGRQTWGTIDWLATQ